VVVEVENVALLLVACSCGLDSIGHELSSE
jgi:hypothetical protein